MGFGFAYGTFYGPLLDSGGICSVGPLCAWFFLGVERFQIRGPYEGRAVWTVEWKGQESRPYWSNCPNCSYLRLPNTRLTHVLIWKHYTCCRSLGTLAPRGMVLGFSTQGCFFFVLVSCFLATGPWLHRFSHKTTLNLKP